MASKKTDKRGAPPPDPPTPPADPVAVQSEPSGPPEAPEPAASPAPPVPAEPAPPAAAHASCHSEAPPPPAEGGETLHPSLERAILAGRGKPVTLVVDASGAGPAHRYVRADIELERLDHAGVSYEGRVFFNNPQASQATPMDIDQGFAGRYFVLGHGQCFGGEGHCDVPEQYRPEDRRRRHPLERIGQRLTVTDAIRRAAAAGAKVSVTIVPVIHAATRHCNLDDVVRFDRLRLVTYNA